MLGLISRPRDRRRRNHTGTIQHSLHHHSHGIKEHSITLRRRLRYASSRSHHQASSGVGAHRHREKGDSAQSPVPHADFWIHRSSTRTIRSLMVLSWRNKGLSRRSRKGLQPGSSPRTSLSPIFKSSTTVKTENAHLTTVGLTVRRPSISTLPTCTYAPGQLLW